MIILKYQWLGPFVIHRKINDVTFRLDLHPQLQLYPIFHSSSLEPYLVSSIPNHTTPPPPLFELKMN